MMVALELILSAIILIIAAIYLTAWLKAIGDLVWLLLLFRSLTTLVLLSIFSILAVLSPVLFHAGLWTTVLVAIIFVPLPAQWVTNVLAWNRARRAFTSHGAVLTSQPSWDRPLALLPDLLKPAHARALRRSKIWMAVRRAIWAAPLFAIQQRQSEQAIAYERPAIVNGGTNGED